MWRPNWVVESKVPTRGTCTWDTTLNPQNMHLPQILEGWWEQDSLWHHVFSYTLNIEGIWIHQGLHLKLECVRSPKLVVTVFKIYSKKRSSLVCFLTFHQVIKVILLAKSYVRSSDYDAFWIFFIIFYFERKCFYNDDVNLYSNWMDVI